MRGKITLLASVFAGTIAFPAFAQDAAADVAAEEESSTEIIVTAQRSSQRLQDVPIAVSAFNAEALDRQQIRNTSDLQLTLPNVTFTKTTFTSSSFTIRGVGDLCVGFSCDQATAIHVNGSPVASTRLFESEMFDMERVEVLRGPQGTLYGRNATSGVVNFITAKPRLGSLQASGEAEYGNYNYMKVKGMVNVPVGESMALRVAGYYTKRDGFTENLFNNSKIDGRDMYGVRGSLRWEPGPDTKLTLMAYYFKEDDNRLRIQRNLCHRDPTGVLGCLPDRLGFDRPNSSSGFTGTLTSRQTYGILNPGFANFGLGTLNNPTLATDYYGNNPILTNLRQAYTDYNPTYLAEEQQYQAEIDHDFGAVKLQVTGMYQKSKVDSTIDSDQSVVNRNLASFAGGLGTFAGASLFPNPLQAFLAPAYAAITPGGPAGQLCTSVPNEGLTGAFGGSKVCADTPMNFDRSRGDTRSWSVEAIASTDLDGAFNFLVGGIYSDVATTEGSYTVNGFLIDYASAIFGMAQSAGRAPLGVRPSFMGSPYFNSDTPSYKLKSYGLFGEAYVQVNDKIKLTLGARYSNDDKDQVSRQTFFAVVTPHGSSDVATSPLYNGFNFIGAPASAYLAPFDANASTACSSTATPTGIVTVTSGCEPFAVRNVKSSAVTGRAVLDIQLTDDNLLYFSYSRGYKSGGINPPLGPQFQAIASSTFKPEKIDAFEVGSKNTWGAFTFNATAFYYKYGGMQLSRIVNRNAINDNVNANIYGVELEAVFRPSPRWNINAGFSALKTKVSGDLFIADPRDPSGGRSDIVILKDFLQAYNCVVIPNTTAANANLLVNTINGAMGLAPAGPIPGVAANGAFGNCGAIQAAIAGNIGAAGAALAPLQAPLSGAAFNGTAVTPGTPLAFSYTTGGVLQNIKGKELPGAPNFKWNIGAQYTVPLGGGMKLSPRVDIVYTGESFGNIFNGNVNRLKGYEQINAQIQLSGDQDKWFLRGFVQNLTDNSAMTGLTVGDQSQGLMTNVFTLEPRRYGVAAGFKF